MTDLMPEPVLMREPCPECGGDGVDGISYTGVFPCGRCEGTGTIEKSSMVGATIKPHLMVEIAEYAGGKSDRVMIWVNSRDTSRGGYCIDGVPREVAPTIVAALNSTAADALNHWKALARYNGNALVRNAAASSPPTSAGWIVGNVNADRWRTWATTGPEWTDDRDKATRYARRVDAEAVHLADEDAWRIEPYQPLPPTDKEKVNG